MSVFKNVHMKFWQNDFVLGLTAAERYFYIYLITNSMTNQCGIYKFNRRVAELETGYSCDEIENLLKKFEQYGKVIVSKSSPEIMLVNWFKHNFKSNMKALLSINKELKDIKDKELLQKLYDFCCERQYPVNEIFNGIILPKVVVEKENVIEAELVEVAFGQDETKDRVKEAGFSDLSPACEAGNSPKENTEGHTQLINVSLKGGGDLLEAEVNEENQAEEAVAWEDYPEEDNEDIIEGTPVAFWSFSDS